MSDEFYGFDDDDFDGCEHGVGFDCNYREQAIKDVAEAVDDDEDFVDGYAEGCDESDDYGRAVNYAVAQREARLRLEDALRWFLTDPRFDVSVGGNPIVVAKMLTDARAALDAVKEG